MKHLKEEFDKLTFKETIVYSMAVFSLIAGFVLLFIGFYTAPRGEIHDSVLYVFGINLLFVGSLLGISMHYANELTHFKGVVTNMLGQTRVKAEQSEGQPDGVATVKSDINLDK